MLLFQRKATKASAIIEEAHDKAKQITSEVEADSKEIKLALSDAKAARSDAKSAKDASDALTLSLQQQLAIADKTIKDAALIKKEAEAFKEDLIEKHTAFLKGL